MSYDELKSLIDQNLTVYGRDFSVQLIQNDNQKIQETPAELNIIIFLKKAEQDKPTRHFTVCIHDKITSSLYYFDPLVIDDLRKRNLAQIKEYSTRASPYYHIKFKHNKNKW